MKSHRIHLSDLESFVRQIESSGEFEYEFESLGDPKTQLKSMDTAHLPVNAQTKHRYPKDNLGAYDETRVVLSKIEGDCGLDYINANWINGYKDNRRYIVTQAPLDSTIPDFYRMVWENNVHQIIMLASLDDLEKTNKCIKYYPDTSATYGNIEVNLQRQIFLPYVIQRNYTLKQGDMLRLLVHYHFISWPDFGVPENPSQILDLIQLYKNSDAYSRVWPLLIHCSAGVGRTGSFVLSDSMFDMAEYEDHVDFLNSLSLLRTQRISMVEKPIQYLLSHKVILAAFHRGLFQTKMNN